MVDSVNIENVGGDAGIASEVTLKRLLITMELMANKTGANSQEAIKKANEQYKKSIKDLDKATKDGLEKKKKNTKETERATKATKAYTVAVGGAAAAIMSVSAGFKGFANELIQGGNDLGDFTKHLPFFGKFLTPFASFIDKSISSFRELSTVGAAFSNDITEMRMTAVKFGVTLDELTALITSNSETIRVLGGTVAEGVKRFEKLNNVIKATGDFRGLMRLGFTVEEVNEGLLSYVELQTRLGRAQQMSTKELATGSAEYMKELDLLAKVTGKSRKEVEENLLTLAQDAGFRALANQFDEGTEQMTNFKRSMMFVDSLPPLMADVAKDLADGAAQTEKAQDFLAAAGTEGQKFMDVMTAAARGEDVTDRLPKAIAAAGDAIQNFGGTVGPGQAMLVEGLRQAGSGIAEFMDISTELSRVSKASFESARKEQEERDATTETLATFELSVRKIREILQTAVVQGGVLEAVADGAAALAGVINSDEFKTATQRFADWVVETVKDFTTLFSGQEGKSMSDTIADGIVGIFADDGIVSAIASGISTVFGKVVDKIFGSGGQEATEAKGAGRGATGSWGKEEQEFGFLKSIGTVVENVGVGMAALVGALVAAGTLPVLIGIGAGVIAASLGTIVAAVGAASELTDGTFVRVVESLSKFAELDADKLSDLGSALVSFSAGIGAFAAAGVGQGLGNIVENVQGFFGWATSFLPGEEKAVNGPLDMIKQFADMPLETEKLTKNAEALSAFGTAFESLARSNVSDIDLSLRTIDTLEKLGNIPAGGLESTARGMRAIATLPDFDTKLNALNQLDASKVDDYRESLDELVDTLRDLNKELIGGKGFGPGRNKPETTAGDVFSQMTPKKGPNEVNTSALLSVLEEIRELNKRTLRAIDNLSDNLQ